MLNSITLLRAVGEIGEESVFDTIRVLHLLNDQPHQRHTSRKIWRIVLIAAIIAALLTVEGGGGSVIDMYERASVTVADRTFLLSSIVDSQD